MRQIPSLPLYEEQIRQGQMALGNQLELLSKTFAPDRYQSLPQNNLHQAEPLLFAYFGCDSKPIEIEQLLWGYTPEKLRRKDTCVYVDENGCIELPNYGYLLCSQRSKHLTLNYQETAKLLLFDGEDIIDFVFEPYIEIPGTNIKLYSHSNVLLKHLFVDEHNEIQSVEMVAIDDQRLKQIEKAFQIIEDLVPQYSFLIKETVKGVFLYKGAAPNSFATMASHGMVFLQTDDDSDEIFFAEDLVHQCGHVIFSALNQSVKLLKVPEELPLERLTQNVNEDRSVFVALHGLYTEAWMCETLARNLSAHWNTSEQLMETLGRLAMIFTRFGVDLSSMYPFDIFSDEGRFLMDKLFELYTTIYEELKFDLENIDISNQPYCFNKALFFKNNYTTNTGLKTKMPLTA